MTLVTLFYWIGIVLVFFLSFFIHKRIYRNRKFYSNGRSIYVGFIGIFFYLLISFTIILYSTESKAKKLVKQDRYEDAFAYADSCTLTSEDDVWSNIQKHVFKKAMKQVLLERIRNNKGETNGQK